MLASTVQFSTTTRTNAHTPHQEMRATDRPRQQPTPTHGDPVVLSGPNSVPPRTHLHGQPRRQRTGTVWCFHFSRATPSHPQPPGEPGGRGGTGALHHRPTQRTEQTSVNTSGRRCPVKLLRKEVIQPHLPVRLPCYDFVPIASPTFDRSPPCGLGHGLRVLPTFVT
jgi:hypothetical protein